MGLKVYLAISGIIFGVVAVLHLLRLMYKTEVRAGNWALPVWVSCGGLVAAGFLCAWAWRLFFAQ